MLHDGTSLEIAVVQHGSASAPRLEAALSPHRLGSAAKNIAAATLTRLLGLDRDLSGFYTQAAADETLAPLAQRYRGLKPPRFPTVFECLLNAVACQQLSIEAGLTLLNRLAATAHPDQPAPPPFPAPAEVAALTSQQLRAAGFSAQKTNTIHALAAATHAGLLDLEALEQADNASASARLLQLRGIGPWSADYVLLRGLGRLSVFPRSDIGALNGLRRLLATASADEAQQALSRWTPYAGLVYFHLLLNGLEARRILDVPGAATHQTNAVKTDINKLKKKREKTMRLNYRKVLPKAVEAMAGLEDVVIESALEPELLELVKMRASQLNGCAYCLDMHSKDARARGEDEQRLHVLAAWREAPFYSERERAALAWCEALTLLPQTGAPDDLYEQLRAQFDEDEIVALTLAIVAINGWNRFAVGFRSPVGSYVSPHAVAAQTTEGR